MPTRRRARRTRGTRKHTTTPGRGGRRCSRSCDAYCVMRPMRSRILVALILTLGAVAANAQVLQVKQYAAKFVCGKATDAQFGTFDFAPGSYFTEGLLVDVV